MNMFSTLSTKLMALGIGLVLLLLAVVVAISYLQKKPADTTVNSQNGQSAQDQIARHEFIEAERELVPGFPELPVYPGAELEESSKRVQPIDTNRDLRAEWHTDTDVPIVASWYLAELPKMGWKIDEAPNDRQADEQIINISKDDLVGYVAVEVELEDSGEEIIEIVADFRKVGQ